MRAQILINGFGADFLYEDIKDYFTIEKGVEDDDPTGQPSDQTINLKLPNTPRNNKIFGFSADNASKDKGEYEIKILGSGFIVFEGIGCISDIGKKKCANYVLDAWGGQARWVFPLEDMNLCDCIPVTAGHQLNAQTIVNSWSGNDDYVYYPVGYDFIKWHEGIKPTDLRPAIFIYPIIKEVFKKLGFKIKSSHIESNDFKRKTIPFVWGHFGKGATYYEENTHCDESLVSLNQNSVQFSEYIIGRTDGLVCTVSESGNYCFCVDLLLAGRDDNNYPMNYQFCYEVLPAGFSYPTAGGIEPSPNGTQIPFATHKADNEEDFTIEEKFTVTLQVGESLVIWMKTGDNAFLTFVRDARLQGTKIGYHYSQNQGEGDIINFKNFMPRNLKAIDLIKDLKKLYNWRFETDNYRKTICIEIRHGGEQSGEVFEPFFKDGQIQDATSKMLNNNDVNTKARYKNNTAKRDIFGYKNDGDDHYQKRHKENYPDTLYRAKFESKKTLASGEDKCVTSFFAGTMHKRYGWEGRVRVVVNGIPSYVSANANGIIPFIMSEEQTLTEGIDIKDYGETFCPRILHYHGMSRPENDKILMIDPLTGNLMDDYPLAYMVNYDDPTASDPNLGFSDDIVLGGSIKGLASKYHLLELILKRSRHLDSVQMLFGPHEIHKFSFRKMWCIRMDTDSSPTKWIPLNFKDFTTIVRCPLSMEFQRYRLPTKEEKQSLSSWTCTGLVGKSPVQIQTGCTAIRFEMIELFGTPGGRVGRDGFRMADRLPTSRMGSGDLQGWCLKITNINDFDDQQNHIVVPEFGIDAWVTDPFCCVGIDGPPKTCEMRFWKCDKLLEIRIELTDNLNYSIYSNDGTGKILALQVVNGEEIINLDLLKICC